MVSFTHPLRKLLLTALSAIALLIVLEGLAFVGVLTSSALFGTPNSTLDGRPRFIFHPLLTGLPLIYSNPFGLDECTLIHPIFGIANRQSDYCRDGGGVDKYGFLRNSGADRVIERDENLIVFILGGSTVLGRGNSAVENTISAQLEKKIKEAGIPAQVINAGHDGYYSPQEFDLLAHEIVFFRPDVVISLNGINDILQANECCRPVNNRPYTYYMNASSFDLFELVDRRLTSVLYPLVISAGNLKVRFYRYTFLGWSISQLQSRLFPRSDGPVQDDIARQVDEVLSDSKWKRKLIDQEWHDKISRGAQYYASYALMTSSVSASLGIRHLQVFQPSLFWDEKISEEDRLMIDRYAAKVYVTRGEDLKRRSKFFASEALETMSGALPHLIDMRGIFGGDRQYYADSVHYSDAGSEVIAEKLLNHLARLGWLERGMQATLD